MTKETASKGIGDLLVRIKEGPGLALSLPILISHWVFFPLAIAHLAILAEKTTGSWARYHSYPGEGLVIPLLIVTMILMTATKLSEAKYGPSKSSLVKLGIAPFEVITLIASAVVAWVAGLLLLMAVVISVSNSGIFGVPAVLWHLTGIYLYLYWFVAYGNGPDPSEEANPS